MPDTSRPLYNLGSINIDHVYRVPHLVRPGETLASTGYQQVLGGKGANQSLAMALAGGRVEHWGRLGLSDDWALRQLTDAGVGTAALDLVDEPSGHALIQVDDKANLLKKAPGIMIATVCGMVFLFSVVAFRSLVLGPRLLLTVALTLGIVSGATAIVFEEVFWLTLVVVSPVSVGFVLDYDIFLLGRVFEFRTEGYSTSDALILGLEHTGGIITTAGIIMVSAFLALLMSSNPVVVQLGFQLSIAVLVDTFLIRTFFVPALMQIGVEWNWWPKKMPKVTKKM